MNNLQNKKKPFLIGALSVICLSIAVYFIFFFPPVSDEESTGTIGRVKKYYSQQMSDDDVILRNALSSDKGRVQQSFNEIQEYKNFIESFDYDISNWMKQLTLVVEKKKGSPDETLDKLTKTIDSYKNIKMFMTQRKGIIDTTLEVLDILIKSDTLNKKLPIENILLDFFRFENEISKHFISVIIDLPEVNSALKKYGERQILADFDERLLMERKSQPIKFSADCKLSSYLGSQNTALFNTISAVSCVKNKANDCCILVTDKLSGVIVFVKDNLGLIKASLAKDNFGTDKLGPFMVASNAIFMNKENFSGLFSTNLKDNFSPLIKVQGFQDKLNEIYGNIKIY